MAKIALDAGHGLYTPGKRCLKKLDKRETREWIINDRVTDALELYLKMAGHSVLRVDDWDDGHTDVTLNDRVRKANNWKADAYISVHHNAGINGGSGGGTVVYVSKGCQAKSIQLQDAVYKRVIVRGKLKGNRSDGTLSANFYVIRKTKMPAILIECGFMDSAVDIKHILDTDWSEQVGLGIAEGVCEVFGGSIPDQKPSKPAVKPSKPVAPPKPSKPSGNYTGNSIVEYLNSIGKNSSFHARRIYAAQYGIKNYTGTASQNTQLLNAMRGNKKPTASSYYPAFNSTSIVDGLKKIGVDNSFANRKKIAKANGIGNYKGTSSQNNKLCNLARKGKLKKA